MMRWLTPLLAVALMLVSEQAHAQGFSIFLIHYSPAQPLMTECGGSTPIPDGTMVQVFFDVDSDGPDLDDPQPTVCTDPPECITPFGSLNYDEFPFNGTALNLGAGFFFTDPAMTCNQTVPPPGRYYLRIYEQDGITPLWTSSVFTVQVGLQEFWFTDLDWTCGAGGPQCTVLDESE